MTFLGFQTNSGYLFFHMKEWVSFGCLYLHFSTLQALKLPLPNMHHCDKESHPFIQLNRFCVDISVLVNSSQSNQRTLGFSLHFLRVFPLDWNFQIQRLEHAA